MPFLRHWMDVEGVIFNQLTRNNIDVMEAKYIAFMTEPYFWLKNILKDELIICIHPGT